MSQKEAIFLVSRALAVMCGLSALIDAFYLPERLFQAYRYLNMRSVMDTSVFDTSTYLAIEYGVMSPLALIVRMSILAGLVVLFWKGGPWVARLFAPPPD